MRTSQWPCSLSPLTAHHDRSVRHVPAHLRHLLAAESACNDGAAFPFLYIALYLTLQPSPGHAVGEWFYMTWLCTYPPSPSLAAYLIQLDHLLTLAPLFR